jgi:hypothetical protein
MWLKRIHLGFYYNIPQFLLETHCFYVGKYYTLLKIMDVKLTAIIIYLLYNISSVLNSVFLPRIRANALQPMYQYNLLQKLSYPLLTEKQASEQHTSFL